MISGKQSTDTLITHVFASGKLEGQHPRVFRFHKMNIYHTKRWERLRASVLRRDGYMCQASLRYGKHIQANTVHHIFPASKYPQYIWEPWNLISLSASAHNAMHVRDSEELTDEGMALLIRTARRVGVEI